MSAFTKTLIVDGSLDNPDPPYYKTIKEATAALTPPTGAGGTIIVESGVYEIDGNVNQTTISIPSNTTVSVEEM